ncbi:MAG: nitrate reductase [Proteobacteria bacterium]|nr:MAG: nitrate reductase [Pseudomonadota bacterium]PIE66879.1 MAG: nitrate reductase [Deltaproteobacteria bacterium]
MHSFYNFVSGPLAWVAFMLFLGGSIYRIVSMLKLVADKERYLFTYMSWRYSLRSIFHWIVPFATVSWRRQPILTVVTFAFHICLLAAPIFLLSHVVLWNEAFGISWCTLPDAVTDVMTVIVILGAVYFLVRRLSRPEVKFVTTGSDFLILAIVAAPFVTGFIAYHQWFNYPLMMGFHVLAGDIMLAAIPFTRLSHMIFSPFTRAYMGSEFGGIRHARDW